MNWKEELEQDMRDEWEKILKKNVEDDKIKGLSESFNESYESVGKRIGKLVDEKQKAYGDSFTRAELIMKILYPTGIKVSQYKDVLAMVRCIDKMSRIATEKEAYGENPWEDLSGYGILMSKEKK